MFYFSINFHELFRNKTDISYWLSYLLHIFVSEHFQDFR